MNIKEQINHIATYHGSDGTSGYLLSDSQVDQILDLLLKALPEEQILHSYMKENIKGEPSDFWRGWNAYRLHVMSSFNKLNKE